MIGRIGNVIYWAGWFIAIGILLNARDITYKTIDYTIISIVAGWALRYILTGKKTIKP